MTRQRTWTPEQLERRHDYLRRYAECKRKGIPMQTKYYNKEKPGWTTPGENPIRIYQNSNSTGKILVHEENFSHYHSPDPDAIRFPNL